MTLIELLFFLTPFCLSGLLWTIIFWRFGAMGAVAAIVTGFGIWVWLWVMLRRWDRKGADRLKKP
jgi:hypothetical protein